MVLELKLLADVGLVGFPNVGKSTLLSVVSKARPKIADYHFTTLMPNLGVVYLEEGVSFVLADIPGLIEGAAEGAGLGHDFLRHVDRCRLLIHLVDVSGREGRDPVEDFEAICRELAAYSPELAQRPMVVAGAKLDIAQDPCLAEALRAHVEAKGMPFFLLSAVTHQGVDELMGYAAGRLQSSPPSRSTSQTTSRSPPSWTPAARSPSSRWDGVWMVDGPWLQRLMANVNFGDVESRNWFDRVLRESGLSSAWRPWGSRTGTLSASTIWSLSIRNNRYCQISRKTAAEHGLRCRLPLFPKGDLKFLDAHIAGGNLVLLEHHHGVSVDAQVEGLAVPDGGEALDAAAAVPVAVGGVLAALGDLLLHRGVDGLLPVLPQEVPEGHVFAGGQVHGVGKNCSEAVARTWVTVTTKERYPSPWYLTS